MSLLRFGISALSPAGQRARLSIFIFHRVLPAPDPLFPDEIDAERFDRVVGWLKTWFEVLPLDVAARCLNKDKLPARAAAITFDDGYADNHGIALPILRRHGVPATFFIATGFLDGGRMWNDTVIESVRACRLPVLDLTEHGLGSHPLDSIDARRGVIRDVIRGIKYLPIDQRMALGTAITQAAQVVPPDDLMMRADQVRELRQAGMQIGAHTLTHPILARLDITAARREIAESRGQLEELLGERVGLFAYPNGRTGSDYLPEHALLVQELGFDAAVTTDWGAADAATDVFRLPRFTPWDRSRLAFGLRLMRNLRSPAPAGLERTSLGVDGADTKGGAKRA